MSTAVFNFDDAKSGRLVPTMEGYDVYTGFAQCHAGQNPTQTWRAFFSFDTSSLPAGAVVSKVELWQTLADVQPEGEPDAIYLKYHLGTFIGVALNGSSDEWNGGTYVHQETSEQDGVWIDISNQADPSSLVNLSGDTDLKIVDDSSQNGGASSWGTDFNDAKDKCRLRVTYTYVGSIEVALEPVHAIGAAQDISVGVTAVSVALNAIEAAGSLPSMSLQPGAVDIPMDALQAAGSVPGLTVDVTAVSVILDALTLVGSARSLEVAAAYSAILNALTLTGSVPSLTVQPGPATVSLSAIQLQGLAANILRLGGVINLAERRTVDVAAETRLIDVPAEDRSAIIAEEDRQIAVPAGDRFPAIPGEDRITEI